jgi:uncharacterized membrane protein YfbV (UPF0208 family)
MEVNEMENKTVEITSFAILIEAIITYLNQYFCWQMALSIVLGIVIAVAYKLLDLPACFNLKSDIPYVGSVLT